MGNAVRDGDGANGHGSGSNLEDLVVISGLSGAGKSSAMNVFEDAGYFCVDNLPAEMIRSLSELFMHDGSKVELAAGLEPLEGFRERGVAVVSLAKRIEEVFLPGNPVPVVMPHDTPELQLVQRVRDEAHRFAITHHRIRRDKAMTESIMDELPGIGPARKRALLKHFGSPEAVLNASREALENVPGFPQKVARDLFNHLNRTGR